MRVALLTAGSHGDVRPFVALARGLQQAGHDVVLGAPSDAESFVTGHGISFASLGVDFRALAATDAVRDSMEGRIRGTLRAYRKAQGTMRSLIYTAGEVASDVDAVVYHPKAIVGAHLAEATGVPVLVALFAPALVPTRAFPAPLGDLPNVGPLNRVTYAANRLGMAAFRGLVNEWRREVLGLGPVGRFDDPCAVRGRPLPVVYPISPTVVDRPFDWPDWVHMTGFWFLDAADAYEPRTDLDAFLDAGLPPVYVGFGSLAGRDPETTTRTVLAALRRVGGRALLATGWGGLALGDVPEDVFVLGQAPHDWLFPRCAAVVHHGGAGTTAAGLRAGCPTVICPFFGDQFFWGARVQALGVGPAAVPQKRLTDEVLAAAISEAVTSDAIRRRASSIGEVIRAEDGVAAGVHLVESFLP